jgi:hypothetical protein
MPTYDVTTTPAAGDATKIDDYTRLRDSIRSVASVGTVHDFGGDLEEFVTDSSFIRAPKSRTLQISGDDAGGRTVLFEINVVCDAAATVEMVLWNLTANAAVASSTLSVVLGAAGVVTHSISSALTLATGFALYEIRIRRVSGGNVAGWGRVVARG